MHLHESPQPQAVLHAQLSTLGLQAQVSPQLHALVLHSLVIGASWVSGSNDRYLARMREPALERRG